MEGVSMDSACNAPRPTSAGPGIKASLASLAHPLSVPQVAKEWICCVYMLQLLPEDVTHDERHPAAGTDIAIGQHSN